jgi:hypothetical protein
MRYLDSAVNGMWEIPLRLLSGGAQQLRTHSVEGDQ